MALLRSRIEGRSLLTRSRGIARKGLQWPPAGGMVLGSERPADQLVEVARRYPIFETARPFTRCSECNELLRPAEPAWARSRVPEYVARTQTRFDLCPVCGKLFWQATHASPILDLLQASARRAGQELPGRAGGQKSDAGPELSDPASKG